MKRVTCEGKKSRCAECSFCETVCHVCAEKNAVWGDLCMDCLRNHPVEELAITDVGDAKKVYEMVIDHLLNEMFDAYSEHLSYLYCRWQDEKEYEDFQDYADSMKRLVGKDFLKATKSPFGFQLLITFFGKSRIASCTINSKGFRFALKKENS